MTFRSCTEYICKIRIMSVSITHVHGIKYDKSGLLSGATENRSSNCLVITSSNSSKIHHCLCSQGGHGHMWHKPIMGVCEQKLPWKSCVLMRVFFRVCYAAPWCTMSSKSKRRQASYILEKACNSIHPPQFVAAVWYGRYNWCMWEWAKTILGRNGWD